MPLAEAVGIAVGAADGATLDGVVDVRAVHAAAEGEGLARFGAEDDVLFVDGAFEFALLAGAFVAAGDEASLLNDLHRLSALDAVGTFGVNRPGAGDVGGLLLRGG